MLIRVYIHRFGSIEEILGGIVPHTQIETLSGVGIRQRGLGNRYELPQWGPGRTSAGNAFWRILKAA